MKTRILLYKVDNGYGSCGGGNDIIKEDGNKLIAKRCGHIVRDPKDDNKCAECNKQHGDVNNMFDVTKMI